MDRHGILIGLEVHCQLTSLKTKLFCGCSSEYRGKEPNTNVCPVCLGLPGTLPVLNKRAVEEALKVALALNSKISRRMLFYRKNYHYPDMPKNFQISQYDKAGGVPLALGGFVDLNEGRVRIRRIQLEEDPARLVYEGTIASSAYTLVDYNRAGIALIEVVTEPDIKSPKHAREFLQKLRSILEHLGVCDGSLDGAIRCDANISLEGGKRVEVKNITSFKEVERALSFEITRQRTIRRSEEGMETRHWDDVRRVTVSLRRKEEEEDYRYFPEPDLVPVVISDEEIIRVKSQMPELPDVRRQRFVDEYGISKLDAEVMIEDKALADYFEDCLKYHFSPVRIGHWLVGEVLGYLNRTDVRVQDLTVEPKDLAELARLVDTGKVSEKAAKSALLEALHKGKPPQLIVVEGKLSDEASIREVVRKVIKENPKAVHDVKENPKAVHFLIGLVMKATKGRADPEATARFLNEELFGSK